MALSQVQCLDDNHINLRTNESKPDFFYSEEQRLALETLIHEGQGAYEDYIKTHKPAAFCRTLSLRGSSALWRCIARAPLIILLSCCWGTVMGRRFPFSTGLTAQTAPSHSWTSAGRTDRSTAESLVRKCTLSPLMRGSHILKRSLEKLSPKHKR